MTNTLGSPGASSLALRNDCHSRRSPTPVSEALVCSVRLTCYTASQDGNWQSNTWKSPPQPFPFSRPEEWNRWIRSFERFRQAARLIEQSEEAQLNMLIYSMGDQADDILQSFKFNADEGEDEKSYTHIRIHTSGHQGITKC